MSFAALCHNVYSMQVLQAGQHKLIYLELDVDTVTDVAKQAGFDIKIQGRRAQPDGGVDRRRPPVAAAAV